MEYINGNAKSKFKVARQILAVIKCYESIPKKERYIFRDTDLYDPFNDYIFNTSDEIKKSISNGDDPHETAQHTLNAIEELDEIPVVGSERLNRVRLDLLEFANWHIVDRINSVWLLRQINSKGRNQT